MGEEPFVPRYRHSLFVRYSEADQQGVAFNGHYLFWCDDAMDRWLRSTGWHIGSEPYDFMVRRTELDFADGARYADTVDIDMAVTRWGRTSFDVTFRGTVAGRPVFTATTTYVGVRLGTTETMPPPESFRTALEA